ncbi:trigger factor, partial [Methylicorpusculum sp.]|nr:trigger factor [Methylicorpusculum sp.]
GKPATFEIEVTKVEEPSYPELDEAFIKSYGIENGDMNAFREDVKANMERELAMALNGQLKNAVMDALFDKIKVTLPSSLVDEEINNLQKPYRENAKKQKLNAEDLNLPRDMFEEQANRRVALGLILAEIIHKNGIKVSPDKVRETIEDMAKSYERPTDVVNWYYSDEQRLNEVRQMVLEDQTVEWIVSQAKVVDENVSFDAIMTTQQS